MTESLIFGGKQLVFEIKPGVFAQYGLDFGSKLLLETVRVPERGVLLDLGCGCGVIGITMAGAYPDLRVYLADSDIRAIRLARKNAKINKIGNVEFVLSDVVEDIESELMFDAIYSNPPTHQGRAVLDQFLRGAHARLKPGGEAYFVVNRMTSVLNRMGEVFGNCEKIARRRGYIVFKATRK